MVDPLFWRGKRVLLTGHTGFKGGWMMIWLRHLGAEVIGISLPPAGEAHLFGHALVDAGIESHFCDIRDADRLSTVVRDAQPEIVIHLAAQALVRASYCDPVGTFASNVMGSANLLESLRGLDHVRVAVMVTTDKVYHNFERSTPYCEEDRLGGHDPYSASKAASELVIASYRDAFLRNQGVAIASARAGNAIGGGDWSVDRLIPDALRAWRTDQVLQVRHPDAIRPWQHVLEPLHGYLRLAETLWHQPDLCGSYNFGPHNHVTATVRDVVERARLAYGRGDVHYASENEGPPEVKLLTLETAKARTVLGVSPKWELSETVMRTVAWHRHFEDGECPRVLCLAEINDYQMALMGIAKS